MIYVTVHGEALLSDEEVDLSTTLKRKDSPDAGGVTDESRHRIAQSHSSTCPFGDNPAFHMVKYSSWRILLDLHV